MACVFSAINDLRVLTMFCQNPPTTHLFPMKPVIWLPSSCALILVLAGCANKGSNPNDPLGTGPFDSAGNYREDWADDPSKWRKPGSRKQATPPATDLPVITKNEEPPPNANPLSPQTASKPQPTPNRVESAPRETTRTTEEPKTASVEPKPKPTVVKAKPKPKPKPKPTRYIVKKGDSLSTIASRNGTSVAALRRANGISGSLIRPGQALVIPKK